MAKQQLSQVRMKNHESGVKFEQSVERMMNFIDAVNKRQEKLFICTKCETFLFAKNITSCPECGSKHVV